MKSSNFAVALVLTIAAVVKATSQATQYDGKPDFSIGSRYVEPNYSQPYLAREPLPSADFNRRVYEFDNDKAIWDQNDYEERVRVEAELMVALESLKDSVAYGSMDVSKLQAEIRAQYEKISANEYDIYEDLARAVQYFDRSIAKVYTAQDKCHLTEGAMHENR